MTEQSERLRTYPGDRSRFECPECGHYLPVDGWTKCDQCGAHLELRVRVGASGVAV